MDQLKGQNPDQAGLGIEGARLSPLKVISTSGGPVLHMLRNDSPLFSSFGEIYFSEVEPGAIKAWKCHRLQTQLFAVPVGRIRLVLFDGRSDLSGAGLIKEVILGRPDAYSLLRVPNGVWYGFTALGQEKALLCNCADMPHDPAESISKRFDDPSIPYRWK